MKRPMSMEVIASKIYLIRGQRVMFDEDLAKLYGVATKRLIEQVRRNHFRFPEDFVFQITAKEFSNLRSQFATSSYGGRRYLPYAFTENGVAMLSSVLNSRQAVEVNIQIMRIFTRLRELLLSHKDLALKISSLEKDVKEHNQYFKIVFRAIQEISKEPTAKPKEKIGFHPVR